MEGIMLQPQVRISKAEMKRRYDLLRGKMKETGLNVILVSGVRFIASTGYLRYLTNWAEPFGGEILVFPLSGEAIFFARTEERAYLVENLMGIKAIVGSTADVVATYLRDAGEQMIGICGLKTMMAEFYVQLTKELPHVELKDVSYLIDEVRMIKSAEELSWMRRSAKLGDSAFQVFSRLVDEGREEAEIFLEVEHLVKRLGAETTYFMMAADPKPVVKFLDLACEHYEKGDLVIFNAEIAGPAGYYSQLVRTLSLGQPSQEARKAWEVSLRALEAAERLLRPGTTTMELYKAIRDSIEESGRRMAHDPGHSQGLDAFERPFLNGKEDIVLKEGMVIIIHPHVRMLTGGGIWIGETFVVTSNGCLRLNNSERDLIVL
jgi:Xaa-Pro aminopeptidase